MSHRKQTVPTINYEDCINISSRESIHEEQSNEKVNNFSMLSKKYFNISFKLEVQKQSTLTSSGCHEESQHHLSTIIHSISFVSCSGLTLSNTSSSSTITLPVLWHIQRHNSLHLWVIPIKSSERVQNNQLSHTTHQNNSYNLKSTSSTLFQEEDPHAWVLELVPRQEHSPSRCMTREMNAHDLCSMHLDVGCRMSDTSQVGETAPYDPSTSAKRTCIALPRWKVG